MAKVEAISNSCTQDLPPEFIRPENEQPRFTTFQGPAPVVNLVVKEEKDLVGAVFDASTKWGLFQVVNHGIPAEVIADLQGVGRQFLELPQERREAYAKNTASRGIEGYGSK